MVRVLVVEDEELLADSLQAGLRHEAIAADVAYDGDGAWERIGVNDYDVVVLDRDIPGVHGDELCRIVARDHPDLRVLMLTAAGRLKDKVGGFEIGADDYLTKPFEFEELLARLRALQRRPSCSLIRTCSARRLRTSCRMRSGTTNPAARPRSALVGPL